MLDFLRETSGLTQFAIVARFSMLAVALALAIAMGVRVWLLHARVRTLEGQAVTDPLTGAFNRRHFDACLVQALERRGRLNEPASLLLLDVDRFKDINDALGHVAGDAVLKSLAALVVGRTRKLDVLFRVGGEEFALLLSATAFADAFAVAGELRALVAGAPLIEGRRVTISIGVSELGDARSARGMDRADGCRPLCGEAGR